MKKYLLILAVTAMALVSCSNDETIAENTGLNDANAISFRPFATSLTRAADEHFNVANDKFAVTAFTRGQTTSAYFDNATFTTENGSTFTSENRYYWPSNVNLDFYAYAPLSTEVGGSGGATVTRSYYKEFIITPGTDIPNQPDFVYAATRDWGKATLQTGTSETHQIGSTYTGVTINFCHAESKIAFKLANSNDNLKITVGNVTIGNVPPSGRFTWAGVTGGGNGTNNTDGQYTGRYLNGTWAALGVWNASYSVTMESAASYNIFNGIVAAKNLYSNVASAPNYDMILIPHDINRKTVYNSSSTGAAFNGAYITVQIKIQNKATDDYIVGDAENYVTAMWPLTYIQWKAGHKYTYTIDLAGGGYYTTNQDTNEDLDPILEGAEIKFVSVTVDGWMDVDKEILPLSTTLAALKTQINAGTDCSGYIGYYVDASGNVSITDNSAIGVIAAFTNSTTNADDNFDGSRIYVIAKSDGIGTDKAWATSGTTYASQHTNTNADTQRKGYNQTSALYTLNSSDFPAAKHAWEYQGKNGVAVITGSSGWFLPSEVQMIDIATNYSKLTSILSSSTNYWTSSEDGTATDAREITISSSGSYGNGNFPKTSSYKACPCFVY